MHFCIKYVLRKPDRHFLQQIFTSSDITNIGYNELFFYPYTTSFSTTMLAPFRTRCSLWATVNLSQDEEGNALPRNCQKRTERLPNCR